MNVHKKMEGIVVSGDRLGRKLGYPTINLEVPKKDRQKLKNITNGVYGVILFLEGDPYIGVMNIGVRPTIKGNGDPRIEVHILNFNKDIYGETVKVYNIFFVREEKKFANVSELTSQIEKDIQIVKARLGANETSTSSSLLMHLPDLLFAKIIQDCFGINRGIYNTIDAWFWKEGIVSIKNRRQHILGFLNNHFRYENGKIGAGQLASKLSAYWKREIVVN